MVITTGCFALETNDVMEIGNGVGSSLAKYTDWPLDIIIIITITIINIATVVLTDNDDDRKEQAGEKLSPIFSWVVSPPTLAIIITGDKDDFFCNIFIA